MVKRVRGLSIDQARKLEQPGLENARLRRAIADLTPDKLVLKEATERNFQALPMVEGVLITFGIFWMFQSAEPAGYWDSQEQPSVYDRRSWMTMIP